MDGRQAITDGPQCEFIAFADSTLEFAADDYATALRTFEDDADVGVLLLCSDRCLEANAWWREYSPRLACLLGAPERHAAIIIRRSMFKDTGPFADLSAPIWDWLIRAIENSVTIRMIEAAAEADANRVDPYADELQDLVPDELGSEKDWLLSHLQTVRREELVAEVGSEVDGQALLAGLLNWHGFLEESHQLSQEIEGMGRHVAGDYWHTIMHRREPDYSNAKYWFRRVDSHPIFESLVDRADAILSRCDSGEAADWRSRLRGPLGWDPFVFVDLCARCSELADEPLEQAAREIQRAEMLLLLEQTGADATL